MLPPRTSGIEKLYPEGAASVGPTKGAAGVFGAWKAIVAPASIANPFTLCALQICPCFIGELVMGDPGQLVHVQVATGTVAAPGTVVAHVSFAGASLLSITIIDGADTVAMFTNISVTIPVKPVIIPATTAGLIGRIAVSTLKVTACGVKCIGYEGWNPPAYHLYPTPPDLYHRGLIGDKSMVDPDGSALLSRALTAPAAWAWGDWVPFLTTTVPTYIFGVSATAHALSVTGGESEFQVGIGATGSEVPVARLPINRVVAGGNGGTSLCPRPFLVKAGVLISVRECASTIWPTEAALLFQAMK